MSTDLTTKAPSPLSKKDARKVIYQKLESALQEFRGQVKEKRFESRLKKASRMFANELGAKKPKKDKEKKAKKKEKYQEVLSATNGVS